MEIHLAEKLKSLRREKNVSQEKLAKYLNISFQAVSKWENEGAYPDISLLPEIARFFGITVDELLQAEKLDEAKLCKEYLEKSDEACRNGQDISELIPLWEEACRKMPNNPRVKECLMSTYYDADKVKYQNEIIELGTELYNSDVLTYYKGQAIREIANTYAENNNEEMAKRWASKAYQLMHAQELLNMEIMTDGIELLEEFRFANYWYFRHLYYMPMQMSGAQNLPGGKQYLQAVEKAIAQIYEIVYPDDDMGFESLLLICRQNLRIAEYETALGKEEAVIRHHLGRAFACAKKACTVTDHDLTHPLVMGWHVDAAPSNSKQALHLVKEGLGWECFDCCRDMGWFAALEKELDELL